ncbi:superoxide dismutase Fe [Burkholderia pseudomallei]|nr:superoxide dismutase Fe [Burkholderia pseudomallei]KGD12121.1 superoxide dismutase [Burkholderia pseudomallei]KGD57015.1 superoxide dismutase [Burkholderia pseudomallei]
MRRIKAREFAGLFGLAYNRAFRGIQHCPPYIHFEGTDHGSYAPAAAVR